MRIEWRAWMAVSVLVGALVACAKTDREARTFYANGAAPGTVAAEILREAEDSAKRIRAVIEASQQGAAESQHQLGMIILDTACEYGGEECAKAVLEARTWLTRAAEQGHDSAQLQLWILYSDEYPPEYSILTDHVMAYTWLKIAFDNEASDSQTGQVADKALQEKMTTEQVAVAQKLAAGLSQPHQILTVSVTGPEGNVMRWQRSLRLATVYQAMSGSMLGSEPPQQRRGGAL